MSIYEKFAKNPTAFKSMSGLYIKGFDKLMKKVYKKYPRMEEKRLSRKDRKRAIGAGRKHVLDIRDRVLLALFYFRTYSSQRLAAVIFGVGQAIISRSINQITPIIKECIPIPAKIHKQLNTISNIDELEKLLPGLRVLVDASEQQIQRPKRNDMNKSHYSGKKKLQTSKTRYTTTVSGLILHNTRHSPGKVHDVKIFKMKHPTFPTLDGTQTITMYGDLGYLGAEMVSGTTMLTPIKKPKGRQLTKQQKKFNKILSKIRIYVEHAIRRVKTWRIMGNTYRNPLKKYDLINDVICGLVNYNILGMAT